MAPDKALKNKVSADDKESFYADIGKNKVIVGGPPQWITDAGAVQEKRMRDHYKPGKNNAQDIKIIDFPGIDCFFRHHVLNRLLQYKDILFAFIGRLDFHVQRLFVSFNHVVVNHHCKLQFGRSDC
jgi:hypothetical protein